MGWFSSVKKAVGGIFKGAVAGALIATGFGWATGTLTASFWGMTAIQSTFVRSFLTSMALGFVSNALAEKPTSAAELRGQAVARRDPIMSRKIAYGQVKTAGAIVFLESTGDTNKYLHQCVTLAGHEITSVDSVYFNDQEVKTNLSDGSEVSPVTGTTPDFSTKGKITAHFGSTTQVADANLVSRTSMTTDHRLRGIAYIYTQFEYDQEIYRDGIPNVSAVIKGKKVFDPRSDTTAYSNNAALCILDYLKNDEYGLGCSDDEINEASFITAANVCDEDVTLSDATTEKRYTINGLIDTARSPSQILQEMAAACAGSLFYSNGEWHLVAGKYVSPVYTLTEDDFIGNIQVSTRVSNQANFNAVKGVFLSPDDNWQPVDYPPITSSTFEAEDNNERRYVDMTLPLTTSHSMAQRIAKIALYRNREQISVTVPCKLTAFKYQIGDTVMLDYDRLGWDGKVFEIISWTMDSGEVPAVLLSLKETSTAVYAWDAEEEELTRNNTTLPDPFTVGTVSNLDVTQLSNVLDDGAFQSAVVVTWNRPTDGFITQYEIQWKRGAEETDYGLIIDAATGAADYGAITASVTETLDFGLVSEDVTGTEIYWNSAFTSDQQFVINNVITEEYSIRVRAINGFGVRSAWVGNVITPVADTTAPSAPESLTATGGFRQIYLKWTNPPDEDLDTVSVYRNNTNSSSGAVFIGEVRGTSFTDLGLGINETWYYFVRASDRTGNISGYSSSANATTAFIDAADFSTEVNNLFAEAGAYGIEPVSSLPASGDFDGQIKYDTTANKLYRWDSGTSSWTDDIFSITAGSVDLASFASGIEPVSIVSSLPSPTGYTGAKVVFLTTDNKLYRYDSSVPEWTKAISAVDVSGALDIDNFPSDVRPVEVVNSLPTTGNFDGRQAYLTTDKKLYRYNGTAWTNAVATTDLSGTIADAQIAGMAASKLTTQITATNIADDAITTPKIAAGAITASEIAANTITASQIAAGTITASEIASEAITSEKIAANTISADDIAAGAITAAAIAANTITADEIAAGAIGATEIAASAITAEKIDANAVTTEKIASDAITAGKISAGAIGTTALAAEAVTAAKIAAGTISADKIAANSITGGLLAASGIITSAAQIDDAVITNAKIENGAITTAKIADTIESTDFVSGSTGWQINKSGSAEFQGDIILGGRLDGSLVNHFYGYNQIGAVGVSSSYTYTTLTDDFDVTASATITPNSKYLLVDFKPYIVQRLYNCTVNSWGGFQYQVGELQYYNSSGTWQTACIWWSPVSVHPDRTNDDLNAKPAQYQTPIVGQGLDGVLDIGSTGQFRLYSYLSDTAPSPQDSSSVWHKFMESNSAGGMTSGQVETKTIQYAYQNLDGTGNNGKSRHGTGFSGKLIRVNESILPTGGGWAYLNEGGIGN